MHALRFNVLVAFFITLVSLCSARTVITSQTCTTRSCGSPVKNVYRSTKTVHATIRYTVTRWKTVTKPKTVTKTNTRSLVIIWSTVTLKTATKTTTKWIGTSTHTRKVTVTSPTYIETVLATTLTITPSTVLIPIPSGNFGVNQDPDNKGALSLKKREALPVAGAAKQYASAVTCTKSLITKTGTSDLWKTTTKFSGTVTKTVPTSRTERTTITGKGAKIFTKWESHYKVAFATTMFTKYTPTTWYQTTKTTVLPTPSYIQGCGYRNRSPNPEQLERYVTTYYGPFDRSEKLVFLKSNGTAYDCCASCWTLPKSQGKCLGSIYHYSGAWGPPSCWLTEGIDCEDPWQPDHTSECTLILEGTKPGVCGRQEYSLYGTSSDPPVVVSNGPGCRRFKWKPDTWP